MPCRRQKYRENISYNENKLVCPNNRNDFSCCKFVRYQANESNKQIEPQSPSYKTPVAFKRLFSIIHKPTSILIHPYQSRHANYFVRSPQAQLLLFAGNQPSTQSQSFSQQTATDSADSFGWKILPQVKYTIHCRLFTTRSRLWCLFGTWSVWINFLLPTNQTTNSHHTNTSPQSKFVLCLPVFSL